MVTNHTKHHIFGNGPEDNNESQSIYTFSKKSIIDFYLFNLFSIQPNEYPQATTGGVL